MLVYGENMPKNNQFYVLCPELIKNYPEKVKNYPEKKLAQKLRNFYPKKKIYPIHAVQPGLFHGYYLEYISCVKSSKEKKLSELRALPPPCLCSLGVWCGV